MVTKPNGHAEGGNPDPETDDGVPVTVSDDGEIIYRSDDAGIPTVNPSEVSGSSDAPRRRGRQKGSKNRSGGTGANQYNTYKKQAATDLSGILMSLHMMGAAFLKVPELELDQKEAERLSDAVNRVQAEYNIPILDPKTMAWINLAMVAGGVYGPRIVAHSLRTKREKREGKAQTIDAQPIKVM